MNDAPAEVRDVVETIISTVVDKLSNIDDEISPLAVTPRISLNRTAAQQCLHQQQVPAYKSSFGATNSSPTSNNFFAEVFFFVQLRGWGHYLFRYVHRQTPKKFKLDPWPILRNFKAKWKILAWVSSARLEIITNENSTTLVLCVPLCLLRSQTQFG